MPVILKRYLQERCKEEKVSIEELQMRPLFVSLNKGRKRLTAAGIQYLLRTVGKKAGDFPDLFVFTAASGVCRAAPLHTAKSASPYRYC